MQALAVDLQILRTLLSPELRIAPGRALMARVVAADGNGRGSLSIAGYVLEAELPKNVVAGQELKLLVREVTPERVLLGVSHDATPPATPPPPVQLPGGGRLQVTQRDPGDPGANGSGESASHSLSLRYDAPALGAIDLRFELDPATLQVAVAVSPVALADAQGAAGELGDALASTSPPTPPARAVTVTVTARREPVEIYA